MKKQLILILAAITLLSTSQINRKDNSLICFGEDIIPNESINLNQIRKQNNDNIVDHSKIYSQIGYKDNYYYVRFAISVNIDNLSSISCKLYLNDKYYENSEKTINYLYKSISSNNEYLYYSATDGLVSDKNLSTENYYFACYSLRFKDDKHAYSSLNVEMKINNEIINKKTSLKDEIDQTNNYLLNELDLANTGLKDNNYAYNRTLKIKGIDNKELEYNSLYAHNFTLDDGKNYKNASNDLDYANRENLTKFDSSVTSINVKKAVNKSIGKDYLHYFYNGAGVKTTFNSENDFIGKINVVAASGYLINNSGGFGTGDMIFNKVFDVYVNGYKLDISNEKILPGKSGDYGDAMGNFTNIILDTQFVKGENVIEIISKKPLKEDGTLLYKDPGSNGTQSSPSLDSIEIYSYKECKQLKVEEVPSTCLENGYKKITNEYGLEIIKDIKALGHEIDKNQLTETTSSLKFTCSRCNNEINSLHYCNLNDGNVGGVNGSYNGKENKDRLSPTYITSGSNNIKALLSTALNNDVIRNFYAETSYAQIEFDLENDYVGSVLIKVASGYTTVLKNNHNTWGTGDMIFNKVFDVLVNDNKLNINNELMIKGNDNNGNGFTNGSKGEGYALAFGNWNYILLNNINFVKGKNVIRLNSLSHGYRDVLLDTTSQTGDMSTVSLDTIGII